MNVPPTNSQPSGWRSYIPSPEGQRYIGVALLIIANLIAIFTADWTTAAGLIICEGIAGFVVWSYFSSRKQSQQIPLDPVTSNVAYSHL